MSKQIWVAIIAIIIILGGVWYYQNSAPDQPGEVKVGVILPLTGTSADNGENMRRGLELAVEEINSNTKTNHPITLIYENSEYKSDKSVAAINKLISLDKTKFIIGEYGSSQTLSITPIAEQNKVILITPASQADKISQAGDYIFRTQISADQEAKIFSEYLYKKIGQEKIGILALNSDYGISYIDDFSKHFADLGGSVGLVQKYEAQDINFRTLLLKTKEAGDKNLLLIANRKTAGIILKTAKELNLPLIFFATSVVEGDELIKIAGPAAEGLIYPYPFDADFDSKSVSDYQEKYKSKFSSGSEMISANSYDTLKILSWCLEKVGAEVEAVKQCLYNTQNYGGASGTISFDKNGDVTKNLFIKTVKNGQFVKLEE